MFHNVLLFLFYGGWGRGYNSGALKRLSSDQRLSCESVTVGVGFQRVHREAKLPKLDCDTVAF